LVSCGIYVFDAARIFTIFPAAREARLRKDEEAGEGGFAASTGSSGQLSADLAAASTKIQLESDVLSYLATEGQCYTFELPPKEFWMQIKTGSSLIPANTSLLKHQQPVPTKPVPRLSIPNGAPIPRIIEPVYIHPTAKVAADACIGPNVSIGLRVTIASGVRVKDAIILDNVEVRSNACILRSVIGWDSRIGKWCRVEGNLTESQSLNSGTHKGMKIPSATILGKSVVLADEQVLRNCVVLPHKELKSSFHNEILM
jgi:mannose-1-phosphate guanylyltransferase